MRPPQAEAAAAGLTLAQVLQAGLPLSTRENSLPPQHWKVMRAIIACRTPALGAHHYRCENCGQNHFVPHSCRNRHCPTCQGTNGLEWMHKQAEALLPIPYFHLVFTLPHELNPLIQQNRAALYSLLFDTVSATLLEFGRNHLHAQIGVTAVLHTWSQTLLDHYHLHCIVTGGGLRTDLARWRSTSPHWIFPVKALSKVFRGKFRDGLRQLFMSGTLEFHGQLAPLAARNQFQKLLREVGTKPWVVYAKRPFAGPDAVLAYLARYTHRVGITNRRLLALDVAAQTVSFAYKDYGDDSKRKVMTLGLTEFIRRFRLHILPERFVKIRHYGLLSNRNRTTRIAQAREALTPQTTPKADISHELGVTFPPPPVCPYCRQPRLVLVCVTRPIRHFIDTS